MNQLYDDVLMEIPQDILLTFERYALDVIKAGFKKYSAYTIRERIRWERYIDQADRKFKFPNDWTPVISRWFTQKHPEYVHLFKQKRSMFDD